MATSTSPSTLPQTQRAQILHAFNEPYTYATTHPLPPAPTGHEILVRVLAASYCHTDHVFASGAMQQVLPRIGSHEFAGTIHSFGPALQSEDAQKALGLFPGQLVGVPGRAKGPCGSCEECDSGEGAGDAKGYGVWCSKAGNLGLSADGGWQEWCVVDGRQVAPVPLLEDGQAKMKAVDVAPLMCAGVTVWSALKKAGVKTDAREREHNRGLKVAIVGAGGGLGHLGVQFASALGATVIACDVGDSALKLCREISEECAKQEGRGTVHVVDSAAKSAAALKQEQSQIFDVNQSSGRKPLEGEIGADASIVLPEAQAAFDFGMAILKNHSRCVVVSFPKDGWKFQPRDTVFRHIDIVGVLVGRNKDLREMLAFSADNGVSARIKCFGLDALNDLVKEYEGGKVSGKLVVDMAL